jgi:hemerythrin-like domain-containing protein
MVIIHRLIRRELGALPAMIRRASGDPARARRVAAHAREMLEFLHVHHSGEDELLWPVLRPRVELAQDLIDRMEREHAVVAHAVAAVEADLPGWETSADGEIGERMAARLEEMLPVLREHLDAEEAEVLPLVATHLSEAEWDALADHGFAAIPPRRRLVMLGHMLEEANPAERAHMMAKVPPPARVAFRLIGRRQHAREVAYLRG